MSITTKSSLASLVFAALGGWLIACGDGGGSNVGPAVDAGLSSDGGPIDPDAAVPTAPAITLISVTDPIFQGETARVRFSIDQSVAWRLELGGSGSGLGALLGSGTATAGVAIDAEFPTADFVPGPYTLKLYAGSGTLTDEETIALTVRAKLRVMLVWGVETNNGEDGALWATALAGDVRVGTVTQDWWGVANLTLPDYTVRDTYDVIVFGYDYVQAPTDGERATIGNWLDAYLAQGGALVMLAGASAMGEPLGGMTANGRLPLVRDGTDYTAGGASTIGTATTTHAVMAGVTTLTTATRARTVLGTGATLVASWDDDLPMVATKGAVVALTPYLRSTDATLAGDWNDLLRNAVFWAYEQVAP